MAARRFGMALVAGLAALALVGCDGAPQDEVDEAVDEPVAQAPQPSARGLAATLRAAMGGGTQQVAIVDAQGFGQPMDAATLEIPAGWQVQGGVSWQRGDPCVGNHLRIAWTAAAPDGSEAFEVMHPFTWQVQGRSVQMNPCPVLPFASNRDFLMAVVQQRRTGARVLDYRDRADLAAQATSAVVQREVGTSDHGPVVVTFGDEKSDVGREKSDAKGLDELSAR